MKRAREKVLKNFHHMSLLKFTRHKIVTCLALSTLLFTHYQPTYASKYTWYELTQAQLENKGTCYKLNDIENTDSTITVHGHTFQKKDFNDKNEKVNENNVIWNIKKTKTIKGAQMISLKKKNGDNEEKVSLIRFNTESLSGIGESTKVFLRYKKIARLFAAYNKQTMDKVKDEVKEDDENQKKEYQFLLPNDNRKTLVFRTSNFGEDMEVIERSYGKSGSSEKKITKKDLENLDDEEPNQFFFVEKVTAKVFIAPKMQNKKFYKITNLNQPFAFLDTDYYCKPSDFIEKLNPEKLNQNAIKFGINFFEEIPQSKNKINAIVKVKRIQKVNNSGYKMLVTIESKHKNSVLRGTMKGKIVVIPKDRLDLINIRSQSISRTSVDIKQRRDIKAVCTILYDNDKKTREFITEKNDAHIYTISTNKGKTSSKCYSRFMHLSIQSNLTPPQTRAEHFHAVKTMIATPRVDPKKHTLSPIAEEKPIETKTTTNQFYLLLIGSGLALGIFLPPSSTKTSKEDTEIENPLDEGQDPEPIKH